jgi:hypothetical protein
MGRSRDDDDYEDDDDRPRKRSSGGGAGGLDNVIPFRNGWALGAYYTGIFMGLACVLGGGILGIIPLVLGIIGLMKASADPEARGRVHAWIGIILGVIEILVGCVVIVAVAMSFMGGRPR